MSEIDKGDSLKLAELLGSLSYALDMTEGQPEGVVSQIFSESGTMRGFLAK